MDGRYTELIHMKPHVYMVKALNGALLQLKQVNISMIIKIEVLNFITLSKTIINML